MSRPRKVDEDPDFWVVSRLVIDSDTAMDTGTVSFQDQVNQIIDLETLTYVVQQRVLRLAVAMPHKSMTPQVLAAIGASWMDAFLIGARFQAAKALQQQEEDSDG